MVTLTTKSSNDCWSKIRILFRKFLLYKFQVNYGFFYDTLCLSSLLHYKCVLPTCILFFKLIWSYMMGFLEPAWQEKERVSEKHLEAGHGGRWHFLFGLSRTKETAYLKRVQHDVGILYMYNPCINIQTALDSQWSFCPC